MKFLIVVKVELGCPRHRVAHEVLHILEINCLFSTLALVLRENLLPGDPFGTENLDRVSVDVLCYPRRGLKVILRSVGPASIIKYLKLHETHHVSRQLKFESRDGVAKLVDWTQVRGE